MRLRKSHMKSQNDYLFIENFEVPCRVGITAQERSFPQVVTLSIKLFFPLESAGKSDNLHQTVDYATLIKGIRHLLGKKEYHLIEAVAEDVAQFTLKNMKIEATEIHAGKKVFTEIKSVGAVIFRTRHHR